MPSSGSGPCSCIPAAGVAALGLVLVAAAVPAAHAQALARPTAAEVCPALQPDATGQLLRVVTPRIRVGDTIHYISYGEAIDAVTSSISYGEAGDALIPRSNTRTSADGRSKVSVLANGSIYMPKGGLLRVAGLTIPQAEAAMKLALRRYFRRPALSIVDLEQSSIRVKILGQVQNPGAYKLGSAVTDESEDAAMRQRPNTLEELIVRAGGLLNTADFEQVEVRTAEGRCFRVNLDILKSTASRDGLLALDDGDRITVPVAAASAKLTPEYQWMAKSDLASNKQKIFVVGDVNKPGLIQASWLTTPFEAVALAGGVNRDASKSVFIARRDATSNTFDVQRISVDFRSKDVQQGNSQPIPDGSIIFVGKSTVGNLQQILQNLLTPATLGLGISGALR